MHDKFLVLCTIVHHLWWESCTAVPPQLAQEVSHASAPLLSFSCPGQPGFLKHTAVSCQKTAAMYQEKGIAYPPLEPSRFPFFPDLSSSETHGWMFSACLLLSHCLSCLALQGCEALGGCSGPPSGELYSITKSHLPLDYAWSKSACYFSLSPWNVYMPERRSGGGSETPDRSKLNSFGDFICLQLDLIPAETPKPACPQRFLDIKGGNGRSREQPGCESCGCPAAVLPLSCRALPDTVPQCPAVPVPSTAGCS